MKLFIRIILIALLTYFLSPFMYWFTGMLAAFVICFSLPSTLLNAFVAGFLGVGLIWMGEAWVIDVENSSFFSSQVVELFPYITESIHLVFAAGIIGGLSGGLSGMTGASFKRIFEKRKRRDQYYS